MENQSLKTVKNLTLTNAILTTIAIVPMLGGLLTNYGGFVAISIVAILILMKKNISINKVPNFLALLGAVTAVVSMVLSMAMTSSINVSESISEAQATELLMKALPATIVGFLAWGLFLSAMIMYWINFKKLGTMLDEQ